MVELSETGLYPSVASGEVCPQCQRRVPIPREDKTPRARGQVNIAVPADAENGAEVLRELLAAARERLAEIEDGITYGKDCPPYYILTAVLADWLGGR